MAHFRLITMLMVVNTAFVNRLKFESNTKIGDCAIVDYSHNIVQSRLELLIALLFRDFLMKSLNIENLQSFCYTIVLELPFIVT